MNDELGDEIIIGVDALNAAVAESAQKLVQSTL
jgi:hypothetical protein